MIVLRLRFDIISTLGLLLIIFSGCGRNYSSQPFFIEANVDTTSTTIGEIINYQIWARGSGERQVSFGPWDIDSSLIQIKSEKQLVGEYDDDNGLQFEIALWDTGLIELPAFTVTVYRPGEDIPIVMKTDPVYVMVQSLVQGRGQLGLRPIKGPIPVPVIIPWRLIIFIVLILILVLGMVLTWSKRISTTVSDTEDIPVEPPDLVAKQKIQQLENSRLWDSGLYKEFYFELTFILREYVENSLYIKMLEMTTEEIKLNQALLPYHEDTVHNLIDLLQRANLIKFARQIPTKKKCIDDLGLAEKLVIDTIPYWKQGRTTANMDSKFESTMP